MAPEDEMLEFTRSFFQGSPDLSTTTHSIVRRKFLTHVGRDHLEPEEKQALKRLVEKELLNMQADAGSREGKLDITKVKRSPAPCSDPARKRFRFNSESESSSTPSSPDCSGPPTQNNTTKEETCLRRVLKKAVESSDEEQPTDLVAKMGVEESSEEEGEGSIRSSKQWKEENAEQEDMEREQKGRARKKAGARGKQTPSKTSASKKQVREESEGSEGEAAQSRAKVGGNTGAKCYRESEDSDEEILARKEAREPRSRNKGERMSSKKSRVGRLTGGSGDSEEDKGSASSGDSSGEEDKGSASSGDSSGEEDENLAKRKSKGRAGSGRRQSESSEQEQAIAKAGTVGSTELDSKGERGESDSDSQTQESKERRNRTSKKSSKKGKARSSSSSSDASPEPTAQKAGSRKISCAQDHPAVVRLKRYIWACGVRRNYKKLLGSCRSRKECLSVLRAELEALGMKGNPSLEKCRALREQREEAAEVASLDVANIINSSGRPRRRNAWNPSGEIYHRTLDSEEERPRQAPQDWSHMRGIISSDGESS